MIETNVRSHPILTSFEVAYYLKNFENQGEKIVFSRLIVLLNFKGSSYCNIVIFDFSVTSLIIS